MSEHDDATPNLRSMTRAELDAFATERGIADPAGFPNKDALIEAIEAAPEAGDEAGDADGGEEAEGAEGEKESAPTKAGDRYRVLKGFTLDDGRTVMPDEEFAPEAGSFPARRVKQMVEQKYLRPIG